MKLYKACLIAAVTYSNLVFADISPETLDWVQQEIEKAGMLDSTPTDKISYLKEISEEHNVSAEDITEAVLSFK